LKYIRTPRPKRQKSSIPFRLNFLFFIVFLLFALLVGQLAYLQIANGAKFNTEVNRTGSTVVTGNVPRGIIYDSKGRELVDNKANAAITYTKNVATSSTQMYKTANLLQKYITVDASNLQKRDLKDYFLGSKANVKKVNKYLTKKQQKDTDNVYNYQLKVAGKIMPKFTAAQKQAAAIYKVMNGATQLSTVYIKDSGVTSKEVAVVGEHLTALPGVNLGTDWERSYPNGKSITSIIGTVSSEKSGLPREALTSYLENGYARNDRVGTSYLEKQYETALRGSKSQTKVEINSQDQIVSQVEKFAGQQGQNLNLTIDSDYQNQVEKIVKKYYNQALGSGGAGLSDGMYAVAMNPNTGAVLAMAGVSHNTKTGKITDDALGVINRAFVMGSAVKPAMVLGALQKGVITRSNNTQSDEPIYLKGAPVKKSVYPVGTFSSMNAQMALQVSSNIYMMRLAMKEANATYSPKSVMTMDNDVFSILRGYFAQFGLGTKTGIDLHGEALGVTGKNYNDYGQLAVGSALDLSYGNYDSYTLIEMAQYVSAIANGGYKMQPYVVQSISQTLADGSSGPVVSTTQPNVQSKVLSSTADINFVKQGMWQAVHGTNGWTTATVMNGLNPGVAAKTGTAQTFANGQSTLNVSLIAFAPAKNPQIAIAVVLPDIFTAADDGGYQKLVGRDMISAYYKLHHISKQKGYTAHASTLQ
jgi:cell division protein FtsI/penicillin-binding protein 2